MEILKYGYILKKKLGKFTRSIVSTSHFFVAKKKGFSFLEMLIVVMVISVLFVAFRGSFEVKNKDVLYGQACIETLYGHVNNFLYAGLSSKSIVSGEVAIFPDQYIAKFIPDQQKIVLSYQKEEMTGIYNEIDLNDSARMYCQSKNYTIKMTGDNYEVHINKGLQENHTLQSFYITGSASINTGGNLFLQCDIQGSGCKLMARFETDTRTISIKKYICLVFSEEGACEEWDN